MSDFTTQQLQKVRKFYFFEYFYILLKSIEKYSVIDDIFGEFKVLKKQYRLGESKYKKLTNDIENLTKAQQDRYRYTFKQVMEESKDYELITECNDGTLKLTDKSKELLRLYENDETFSFNLEIFKLMEKRYDNAFRIIISFLYAANLNKSGVLIFPHYSPLELNFERKKIKTTKDIYDYSNALVDKLTEDIHRYLNRHINLSPQNVVLLNNLSKSNLISSNGSDKFDPYKYNVITKRIRDYWITFFLKDLYKWAFTMSNFDLWIYRAKQVGLIHATEAFPFINGKLVFPTSVILYGTKSKDFHSIYEYYDKQKLFIHAPENTEKNQEEFVKSLVEGYFDLRRSYYRSNFINLSALRELVCYSLKISSSLFEEFLNEIYKLSLQGKISIKISLEVDKLPEETNAIYLKRDPIMVNGSYRNIIAIDVSKGDKKNA